MSHTVELQFRDNSSVRVLAKHFTAYDPTDIKKTHFMGVSLKDLNFDSESAFRFSLATFGKRVRQVPLPKLGTFSRAIM